MEEEKREIDLDEGLKITEFIKILSHIESKFPDGTITYIKVKEWNHFHNCVSMQIRYPHYNMSMVLSFREDFLPLDKK